MVSSWGSGVRGGGAVPINVYEPRKGAQAAEGSGELQGPRGPHL